MSTVPVPKKSPLQKLVAYAVATALAVLSIALIAKFLSEMAAIVLLDIKSDTWPWTVQNAMWVVFYCGLAEVLLRWRAARLDEEQLTRAYLPEDDETVLKRGGDDLITIFQKVRASRYRSSCFLPRMIERCVLNFNISGSVDQTNSLLSSSLDLFQHEIDLKHSVIRYIAWLIPTLGFLGTVYGIMLALTYAGDPQNAGAQDMLTNVTGYLGVAFNTTLLALLQAAVLVLLQSLVQTREEETLNRAGQYCLDNLINRLYVA